MYACMSFCLAYLQFIHLTTEWFGIASNCWGYSERLPCGNRKEALWGILCMLDHMHITSHYCVAVVLMLIQETQHLLIFLFCRTRSIAGESHPSNTVVCNLLWVHATHTRTLPSYSLVVTFSFVPGLFFTPIFNQLYTIDMLTAIFFSMPISWNVTLTMEVLLESPWAS